MSKYTNKGKGLDKDITDEVFVFIKFFAIACVIFLLLLAYFKLYNPKKHSVTTKSMYVLNFFQSQVSDMYNKEKKVFSFEKTTPDELCQKLAEASSVYTFDCVDDGVSYKKNFVIKKQKIEIYGLEKAPYKLDGTYVKDFFIDVDLDRKSANTIGIDRFPLRVYSDGYLGGVITPINCSKDDEISYSLTTSPVCAGGNGANFLALDSPFSFDVYQVGGDNGKTRYLSKGIPFLRADCNAYGGEMLAWDGFCDGRYYWLKTCYNDEPCGVSPSKD